jgi:ribosomal protein L19E
LLPTLAPKKHGAKVGHPGPGTRQGSKVSRFESFKVFKTKIRARQKARLFFRD